jgi:monofunctional biosynthetic peptidoglycan transglycosylase
VKGFSNCSAEQIWTTVRQKLGFRMHLHEILLALKNKNPGSLLKQTGLLLGKLLLYVHGVLLFTVLALSLLYSTVNPPITPLMIYRKLSYGYDSKKVEYSNLSQIPRKLQRMVVKIEDYKFYTHPGIDFEALWNAYHLNRRLGRISYGGSTITMQLARSLFLLPSQSYLRKYLEILIALEMDLVMNKHRILELYLNYCEWGKGIYGIGAASRHYYRKRVKDLSTDECRRLATILASPLRYDVYNFSSRKSMLKRYEFLVKRFP